MSRELWSVDVPWACFGIVAENNTVVEAANIASWATGKPLDEVLMYFVGRGGKVQRCMSDEGFSGIVSGGQTGADRGGIEAAIEMDAHYTGWCPKGRRAEDGYIPDHIVLTETREEGYLLRTEINVAFSSATVIFTCGPLTGGSKKTLEFITAQNKPYMWIDLRNEGEYAALIVQFVHDHKVTFLNIAGNRESKAPGIQQKVKTIMMQVLARLT